MPKLLSPDPSTFIPSNVSSFSTHSKIRPVNIKKKTDFNLSNTIIIDKKRTNNIYEKENSNLFNSTKTKKKTTFKATKIEHDKLYSSLSSESFSSMSSSLNLDMSSTSSSATSNMTSSMYSSLNDKSIDSYEYNRHCLKMIDRKFVGILPPKLNDTLSRKSTSKISESLNEVPSKKNGWKIKEYKKKKSLLKSDDIIERNHPILFESLKNFSYGSNSPISSSSASSFLSISEVASHRPISNNIKSVALSYYHHLYDQKQKSINSNNSQPLYKFTYNKNNSNSNKTSKLSNYETFKYDVDQIYNSQQNLITNLLSKRKQKETSILNDQSLIRLEKNLPDNYTANKSILKYDRLTKSTNNIDMDDISDLKIISKLNRNEFLDDEVNVKTFYKNASSCKRKNYSDPHQTAIRDTLDKLDGTQRKEWSTNTNPRSNLAQTSQLEINVCNVNSKSQALRNEISTHLNKPLQLSNLIQVNAKKSLCGLLTADIKLNDQAINFDLNKIDETQYEIKLLPTKTGTYKVNVYLNGLAVGGSPFLIKIDGKEIANNRSLRSKETVSLVDLKRYESTPINFKLMIRAELIDEEINLTVGKEVKLNIIAIDTFKKEKLTNIVGIQSKIFFNNYEIVKNSLEIDSDGNYQLKFLPTKEGVYFIRFYKDGHLIEGSSLELLVKDATLSMVEQRAMFTQVGVPFIMTVDHKNVENLKVRVNMKQHDNSFLTSSSSALSMSSQSTQFSPLLLFMSSLRVEKFIESNNRLRIKFVPIEPVEHTIDIIENGKSIENYPVKLNVYPNKDVLMINENINGVKLGASAKLTLQLNDQKNSLNIRITHLEENAPHYVSFLLSDEYMEIQHIFAALCKFLRINSNRLKDGECISENGQTRVNFLLVDDVDQNSNIYILKDLKSIIDNDKYVIIDLSIHKTIKAVKESLRFGPRNDNVRFKLEKKTNEVYSLEFKPSIIGKYRVDIENFNKPILNSPCFIEAYDPNQVLIEKPADSFLAGIDNFINVDLSKAGLSKFKVWVETPNGSNLPIVFDSNYNKKIGIIPKEIGKCLVFMKLGDALIKGVPLEINAIKAKLPVAHGYGLYRAIENQKAIFNIIAPDNFDSDLNIKIKSPSNKHIGFTITKLSENDFQVTYFPNECGKFLVSIIWSDKQIPESQYEVSVFNPAKVRILNYNNETIKSQILHVDMNEENYIIFDTKQAGLGFLTVEVMSSNYEKLPYSRMVKDKLHKISFTPPSEGEYKINAYWNNLPVRRSSLIARTINYSNLLNDIKIIGDGIIKPKLNEQSEFIIDCTQIKTSNMQPEVSIVSASDEQENIDIKLTQIAQNVYKCTYLLDRSDDYLLSVKINNLHICNSPYQFNVRVETDPIKVKFNKDDIKLGIVGQEIKTLIDTSQAGPGELTASCVGPYKPAFCKFEDKRNGIYLLTIIPQETGKHTLQIRYNDEHIPDSPFNIRISNHPDASKVKVFGPGIYHGVLSDFKSKFACDTKGAGAGQLTVRIKGPKGAFKVEMQRESEKDRKITCKYDPIEAGDYQINVKWSGKHVPNSPYNVKIFKKYEELENYLKENPIEVHETYDNVIQNE